MTAGLEVSGVTMARGRRKVIDGLSLSAQSGTLVAVTGTAGSGKSAVLDALTGRCRIDSGSVSVGGADARVAFVSQAHELIPTLTAIENVALAALALGLPSEQAWERAAHWLDRLALPRAAQANLAEELSGGQHQRVALARALAGDPTLLVADDPTSELDEVSLGRAVDAIGAALAGGAVVVVSTVEPRLLETADIVIDLDHPHQPPT